MALSKADEEIALNGFTSTEGYLGFFDILGFSELIENNDLSYVTGVVSRAIDEAVKKATVISDYNLQPVYTQGEIKSFIFSDTIILYETPRKKKSLVKQRFGDDPDFTEIWIYSFFLVAGILMRIAFEHGIPLRGAISYGEYSYSLTNIFGRSILEAYREEQKKYSWSGCVVCPSAEKTLEELFKTHILDDYNIVCKWDVPEKCGEKTSRYVVRWDDVITDAPWKIGGCDALNSDSEPIESFKSRLESKIETKFNEHNKVHRGKKLNPKEQSKIENTAEFLMFFPPNTLN